MDINEIWKSPLKIFTMMFFALVSFITLLILFSLLFLGTGLGLGALMGSNSLDEFPVIEDSDYTYVEGDRQSENSLLSLPIEGVILGTPSLDSASSMGWMGVTYGYELRKTLEKAAENDAIKGIFLHMQTPGGTIFGARAIFDGIKEYQSKTQKPVLVYIEGFSASGGVMAMVGADAIYADHGSMIGSIGVIGGTLTYFNKPTAIDGGLFGGGVTTEGGIEQTIISAGRGKDLGNPFRRPTAEELATLQKGIDIEYENFVNHVAANRKIDPVTIREKMGAQIFDNKTAQDYGLIDGTLNRNEALAKLEEMAGVTDFKLVSPKKDRRKFWQELLLSSGGKISPARAEKAVQHDICAAVSRVPMAYHGNLNALCAECSEKAF